jgi:hypothetical protein
MQVVARRIIIDIFPIFFRFLKWTWTHNPPNFLHSTRYLYMNHKIAWKNVNQWPFYGINFCKLCLKSISSPGYDKNETEVWQTNVNCLIGYTGYLVGKRMYMCSRSPSQQPVPHCTHSKYLTSNNSNNNLNTQTEKRVQTEWRPEFKW